jgi:periplasmic protein TonB
MSLESRRVSGANSGSLRSCLVEGDPEQRLRERDVRRRALAISVLLQSAVLTALILVPLFGRPERIALANVVPLPPYYSHGETKHPPEAAEPPRARPPQNTCRFCPSRWIPQTIVTHDPPSSRNDGIENVFTGNVPAGSGEIPLFDPRNGVKPPPPGNTRVDKPDVVHFTHIDPARLIHRVEPVYPTLAHQLGRSGRVELRAMIATDGTIQSLQVVSGDPLFYQSALDAVRQWRYTPTVLNGRVVEVDTYITVIYNTQR